MRLPVLGLRAGSTPALVSTEWLAATLASRSRSAAVKVVDASWHMPGAGRDPKAEYEAAALGGAAFFDIDGVCDHRTGLPHMLPAAGDFEAAMDAIPFLLAAAARTKPCFCVPPRSRWSSDRASIHPPI